MKITKLLTSAVITLLMTFTAGAHEAQSTGSQANMPQLSVQLWSVKEDLKQDFKGTLKQLAAMGFEGVEFAGEFGPYNNDAKGLKILLDNLGLKVSGAHVSFSQLEDENFNNTVAFYQALQTSILIVGWDIRAWDATKVDEIVNELIAADKKLAPLGMQTGFHNHGKEFGQFKSTTFWDHIATSTPNSVILQMDVGWVTFAGKDPIEYVKRYPGRTLTTHYKAKIPAGIQGKAPLIGQDVTNWHALIQTNMKIGGTLWLVVEQEEYPNGLTPLQAVKISKLGLDNIITELKASL